jgi:hypothetical protein
MRPAWSRRACRNRRAPTFAKSGWRITVSCENVHVVWSLGKPHRPRRFASSTPTHAGRPQANEPRTGLGLGHAFGFPTENGPLRRSTSRFLKRGISDGVPPTDRRRPMTGLHVDGAAVSLRAVSMGRAGTPSGCGSVGWFARGRCITAVLMPGTTDGVIAGNQWWASSRIGCRSVRRGCARCTCRQ